MKNQLKRDYLNAEEKNVYMISKAYIQLLNGERNLKGKMTKEVWAEWSDRGMITPEMQKNLKLARTYINKFCSELEENLNEYENTRLQKQLLKFDYKLIDDFTARKLMRDFRDKLNYAVIPRENFEETLENICEVNCVGCQKSYRDCAIHHMFDEILIPYCGEEPNCPYASRMDKLTKAEKKHVEELRATLKKKNMFLRGKNNEKELD